MKQPTLTEAEIAALSNEKLNEEFIRYFMEGSPADHPEQPNYTSMATQTDDAIVEQLRGRDTALIAFRRLLPLNASNVDRCRAALRVAIKHGNPYPFETGQTVSLTPHGRKATNRHFPQTGVVTGVGGKKVWVSVNDLPPQRFPHSYWESV